jgi:ankyrin repeat protein
MSTLLNKNIVNLTNHLEISPLHYACFFGSRESIDLLLDLGADINARDVDGATCLHYSINRRCLKTVKKLVMRGADKNILKNDGKSAYDLAIESDNFEIAKILRPKNCLKKYFIMENDIEPLKSNRNYLYLLIFYIIITVIKIIYVFEIDSLFNQTQNDVSARSDNSSYYTSSQLLNSNDYNQTVNKDIDKNIFKINETFVNNFSQFVNCALNEGCSIEIFISLSTLAIDLLVLIIITYFICCLSSISFDKENFFKNKNMQQEISLIVKIFLKKLGTI